jgi:hypothetical protein
MQKHRTNKRGSNPGVALARSSMQRMARPLEVTAKCILGHTEVLTEAQIAEARSIGVAFCSKCQNPMSVRRVAA